MIDVEKNIYVQKAIDKAGSQKALAERLNRSQSLISSWLRNEKKVSVSSVPEIVELTGGEVQAHQLRPDLPMVFKPPK